MNSLKIIIFIGLVIQLINCKGQGKNENTIKVAKVENDRIVLSSQSKDNSLIMPEGTCENCLVSSQKMGIEIVKQFKSILEVYNISFNSELYIYEALETIFSLGQSGDTDDYFSVSFTIKTVSDAIHNIKCKTRTSLEYLILNDCGNDQVVLTKGRIYISFDKIVTDDSNRPRAVAN